MSGAADPNTPNPTQTPASPQTTQTPSSTVSLPESSLADIRRRNLEKGKQRGAKETEAQILKRFGVTSLEELESTVKSARELREAREKEAAAAKGKEKPTQADKPTDKPPEQGARESDAAFDKRMAEFEAKMEKKYGDEVAKVRKELEEKLEAAQAAQLTAEQAKAEEASWAEFRHEAVSEYGVKNDPKMLRRVEAEARKFLLEDLLEEAIKEAGADADEEDVREIWRAKMRAMDENNGERWAKWMDDLRAECPSYFGPKKLASTGTRSPARTPSAADAGAAKKPMSDAEEAAFVEDLRRKEKLRSLQG